MMKSGTAAARIAIVGLGPRSLGALEALVAHLADSGCRVVVDVFEPSDAPGAGPNFHPDESPLCLLNIPFRDIAIRPPAFSRAGSFARWYARHTGNQADPDSFPPRADLGRYLQARLQDLLDISNGTITIVPNKVARIERSDAGWRVHAGDPPRAPYDEVLLTPGQPETAPDDQLAEWQDHARDTQGQLAQAYPAARLAERAQDWAGRTVAIRGLGLSTFDVLRVLTCGQGGRFDAQGYHPSGREPAAIYPFSLNGHPPFPKPATQALDARFDLHPSEVDRFSQAMSQAAVADPDTARAAISAALEPVVTRILTDCGATVPKGAVADWLDAEWTDAGTQEKDLSPMDMLRSGIALAEGACAPTTGYAVGQVWRKAQDALRAGYNPVETPVETAEALVAFDEGLKRYSYGPPLSASRELLALIDAGIVDLDLAVDPDFTLTDSGWTLETGGNTARASVMIDAVLPSPDLSSIVAAPVCTLVENGVLSPLSQGLAARTAADGQVLDEQGHVVPRLCLLGRLALGSVIAVDSLHDCFGKSADRWAKGVCARQEPRR
ncbi:FAD-NAD(P)-binding [Pseudosulfitobacter pseudonitzschiae]|uniref:FAD-dependent urate hydroxylase HpyO/Asp monooxygenase CreE-like FAD/NAD(P)-binding domain-containing protein n=1 Tax=Pseudosulfitobacter pseudonitzschiae TaxID=1402135 RepID=A0A073J0F6_9RHOB|nr:FAD/NAD(P)-binding domain-containing protein [Pseudosulfitobacter pseudonitzschiae]KEJ95350.1 hypothetical protein SUH3_22755 [Pseudosulfitobacter pseudonitzschiae]QKS11381.1 FAD/NAD(P)-binding protein [Pseudosulfitobacter pseudonitzschiae]SHF90058.1 FAD-NAD(P)-binding [Pseudosulfitobacter pseudonitzschiae]